MTHQAEMYLLKNKLRLMKGTIRHTWQSLIGILFVCGVLLYQFLFSIAKIAHGTTASPQGTLYILLAVVALNLFRGFLSQTPVIRMDAASTLFTYNTKLFATILCRKQITSMILSLLGSAIIAFFLSGFIFDTVFVKMTTLITLYFGTSTYFSWIFYHAKGTGKMFALVGFGICTVLLLAASVFSIIGLAVLLFFSVLYTWKYLKLDLPKYYEQLQKIDIAEVAVSQNNYAKMYQLAEENRPAYIKGLKLSHFRSSKHTALWHKSLLELIRMQKGPITLVAVLILFGWLVHKSNMLTFLPLLDDPAITGMITVLCTATALSSLYQLLAKQVQSVCDKRKLGLSIPYSDQQIVLSYGITAIIVNGILTLGISLIYTVFSWHLLLLWFAEIIAYFAQCYALLSKRKIGRSFIVVANILLYAATYFSIISI